ncbi:MAG: hypothetical protein ACTSRG_17440 [Candidatus Helarchaeota archaeon]
MSSQLEETLEKAKKYLKIIEILEETPNQIHNLKFKDWLSRNSKLLQKEMESVGYGVYDYTSLWTSRKNIRIIAEFPIDIYINKKEHLIAKYIPALKHELKGYITEVEKFQKNQSAAPNVLMVSFTSVINDIHNNFRKIIIKEPNNEKDIQNYLEGFLAVKGYSFKREKESSAFSTRSFKPDFTNQNLSIAIEVKYVDSDDKAQNCIEEMSADIKPYSKNWKNILFLVYDKGGNIRDVDEYTNDFNQKGEISIRCIVIKH